MAGRGRRRGDRAVDVVDPREVVDLLSRGQGGEAEQVIQEVEARLTAGTGRLVDGPAGLHFARAVAFRAQDRIRESIEAASLMVVAADREGSPGWRSCALSLRAIQRLILDEEQPASSDVGAVLHDVVRAELDLDAGVDDPIIASNAHTGVAIGYQDLRLYELALPHFEAAHAFALKAPDGSGAPTIWSSNMSQLHLVWALELYRVDQLEAAHEHSRLAGEMAEQAEREAVPGSSWQGLARLFGACARAEGSDPEAAARDIAAEIDTMAGHGVERMLSFVGAFLAVALHRSGRRDDALAVIERSDLDNSQWTDSAIIEHTRARLLTDDSSAAALRYGDVLAHTLWRERLRTLHAAQALRHLDQLQLEQQQITRQASTDPLTGVLNRRGFDTRLAELASGQGQIAVLVVDVDDFKQINDTHGHAAGDAALREVAAALSSALRADDVVARTGGDEFCVLLPHTPADSARRVAARVVRSVRQVADVAVTLSVGVADAPEHQVRRALRAADEAMYRAKRAGGGGYRVAEQHEYRDRRTG